MRQKYFEDMFLKNLNVFRMLKIALAKFHKKTQKYSFRETTKHVVIIPPLAEV